MLTHDDTIAPWHHNTLAGHPFSSAEWFCLQYGDTGLYLDVEGESRQRGANLRTYVRVHKTYPYYTCSGVGGLGRLKPI